MKYTLVAVVLGLIGCTATEAPSAAPCGVVQCAELPNPDEGFGDVDRSADNVGKFDRESVEDAINDLTIDGDLSADDVVAVFEAAGNRVGSGEMGVIRDALETSAFTVSQEARSKALDLAFKANLFDYEATQIDSNITYAGDAIPQAVRDMVSKARLNGAIVYDVNETNSDGETVWTHYPATSEAVQNMAFDYTAVTPDRLYADIDNAAIEYNVISGTETEQWCDPATNACQDYQQVTYTTAVGGTGNIAAQYDEVYHPDIFARGRSKQIWANNCGFLSDGSLHCLPASRRNHRQDVILTNPSLSRCNQVPGHEQDCKHMLYHGHITATDGVIDSVEMSGGLSKRVARGQAVFIDPIALLKAWGFEVKPNLTIRYGNTRSGTPIVDEATGTIIEQP